MKKKTKAKSKKIKADEEDPLAQDMSEFIRNADWKPFSYYFQFAPKDRTLTLRVSSELLERYKALAKKTNQKYQKLMREALIEYLERKVGS